MCSCNPLGKSFGVIEDNICQDKMRFMLILPQLICWSCAKSSVLEAGCVPSSGKF